MFIWPYTSVMLCCFRHAIIGGIINTEKNCHIAVHICILFLGITILCQSITILILIINTNIHVFVFCA